MKNLTEKEIAEQVKARVDDIYKALSEGKEVIITKNKDGIVIKAYTAETL
jgi:nucleoid DNA-binding protein